jgi:outer membrane protein assembly factor BamD
MLGFVVAVWGCSTEETTVQLPPEVRFEAGMKKFHDGDYLDAIEDFRIITLQYQGTAYADDAQFYMAESRFMREEYVLAAYEYEVLLRTMPTSEFISRSRYQRAMCYYNLSPKSHHDQAYTRQAIDEFQAFLEYHPTDPLASDVAAKISELNTKLAKKDYDNGIIYMRLQAYRAAAYYFDLVLEKFHDTPFAEKAQLKKAEALFLRKRYTEARDEIEKFFQRYPNSPDRSEAERLQREIASMLSETHRTTTDERTANGAASLGGN